MLISHSATSDMFALAQGEAAGGLCRNRFWLTVFANPPPHLLSPPTPPPRKQMLKMRPPHGEQMPGRRSPLESGPAAFWRWERLQCQNATRAYQKLIQTRVHKGNFSFLTRNNKNVTAVCSLFVQAHPHGHFQTKGWITSCNLWLVQVSSTPANLYKMGVLQWAKMQIISCWYCFLDYHNWLFIMHRLTHSTESIFRISHTINKHIMFQ